MNENVVLELLRGGVGFVHSSVSAVVGALMTTLFLRRNTELAEFEKIRAGKFREVIDDLLDSGKMTYLEYYKCTNFLQIAKKADEMLKEDNASQVNYEDRVYDFDWFVRFYDYASHISNDEIQYLWAAVFRGEINSPGTTSISLLHALSMMQYEQAKLFYNISRFVFLDYKNNNPHLLLFVSTNRDVYKALGITPASLKGLERLGLVECDFVSEYIYKNKKMLKMGNKVITIYGDPNNENKIKAGNVNLTRDGKILYSIMEPNVRKYRDNILDFTITKFQRRNCRVWINDSEVKR